MNEFEFIHAIKQKNYHQPSIIKGIGDDAAVIRSSSEDIVTAVDTFVEGVHFTKQTMDPFHIGYKALAANISDMAAMGARPALYLVSIVIPPNSTDAELLEMYAGMREIASTYQMDLIGGDTVSGKQLTISVTIIGYVSKTKARYRSDAKDKDIVFVTGTLGDSCAGLHLLLHDDVVKGQERFIRRHQMPTPRVAFSQGFQHIHRVALNDISDGIANELREIAEASNVDIYIDDEKIPTSAYFSQFTVQQQTEWKYFGGEDFELVGTVSPTDWPLIEKIAQNLSLKLTQIGYVAYNGDRRNEVYVQKGSQVHILEKHGYIHHK